MALTSRGRALRWLTDHRYITEDPPGSNSDQRKDGITAALKRCGQVDGVPWCGAWFGSALIAGGVKNVSWRITGVKLIAEDAQAHRLPFRGWVTPADPAWHKKVLRGDGVCLFGLEHVETVRSTAWIYRKLGLIRTEGGNTSSGNAGSQNNGGGSYPRYRRIADVDGFALVDYPDN
jgi:hypothetical protein